jgi:hypothetical protein
MTIASTPPAAPATGRASGRSFLWIGIILALLPLVACIIQFQLKRLTVPWYLPLLSTLGVLLLLLSLRRRRTVWRFLALVLFGLLTAGEWVFLGALMKLPAYTGPAVVGQPFPTFSTTLADGSHFTEAQLKGDKNTVLVFFRGRW